MEPLTFNVSSVWKYNVQSSASWQIDYTRNTNHTCLHKDNIAIFLFTINSLDLTNVILGKLVIEIEYEMGISHAMLFTCEEKKIVVTINL